MEQTNTTTQLCESGTQTWESWRETEARFDKTFIAGSDHRYLSESIVNNKEEYCKRLENEVKALRRKLCICMFDLCYSRSELLEWGFDGEFITKLKLREGLELDEHDTLLILDKIGY